MALQRSPSSRLLLRFDDHLNPTPVDRICSHLACPIQSHRNENHLGSQGASLRVIAAAYTVSTGQLVRVPPPRTDHTLENSWRRSEPRHSDLQVFAAWREAGITVMVIIICESTVHLRLDGYKRGRHRPQCELRRWCSCRRRIAIPFQATPTWPKANTNFGLPRARSKTDSAAYVVSCGQ